MARLLKTAAGFRLALDSSVGMVGPNLRDDVGLVQFALHQLFKAAQIGRVGSGGVSPLKAPTPGPVSVDGGYGKETADHIVAWQTWRRTEPDIAGQLPAPSGNVLTGKKASGWLFATLERDAERAWTSPLWTQLASSGAAPQWLKDRFFDS